MKEVALLIAYNDKGEILLQHKDKDAPSYPNTWCLFGGHVEPGESPLEAIEREIFEELEWQIFGHEFSHEQVINGVKRYFYHLKTLRSTEALLANQHEGDDLRFFAIDQLTNIPINPYHLEAINKLLLN